MNPQTGMPERTFLWRDTYHGAPVAVVRYKEHVAASGMQAEHDQDSDLVIDETGRQVWHSPNGSDTGHFFVGGYIVDGQINRSMGFVQDGGSSEGLPTEVKTLTALDGGRSVSTGMSQDSAHEFVYAVRGGTAVETLQGALEPDGVEGLNLATGKPAWNRCSPTTSRSMTS